MLLVKKVDIQCLFIEIVENAYENVSNKLMPLLFNKDLIKDINKAIKKYSNTVRFNVEEIDSVDFSDFLNSPQIKDLVNDCLISLILSEVTEKDNRILTIADDCINYCLEVIENNYPNLSDNNSIWVIRSYFEHLFLTKNILREVTFPNGKISTFFRHDVFRERFIKDSVYDKSVRRVENELSQTFVPKNNKYEDVKNMYLKSFKHIYQNAFVSIVGEFKFSEFYIPPILYRGPNLDKQLLENFFKQQTRERYVKLRENWKHIFRYSDIIYVIGGAGYGKSLFLQNIVNNYSKMDIKNVQNYLIIYCDLKTFYTNGNASKKTVIDFLRESMITLTGVSDITEDLLKYFIKRGRCIVLLDALDEVPKEVRRELHKKILGCFSTYNPNNKICITSRDRGFIPLEKIEVYHICSLTSFDIEDYLDRMISLKKFRKDNKEKFMAQAKTLIEKNFLNNFLILSLLVNIYKAEKELPENKIDLYETCFNYMAKKREEEKSKIGYNWNVINKFMKDSTFISLSTLAAPNNSDIRRDDVEKLLKKQYKTKYSDEIETEGAIKEFLDFCASRTELFVPSTGDDKFKFFHRSFFEYYYARYIHQQSGVDEMYRLMTAFDIDSEVFELAVALVKEDNEIKYQELLEYIFEQVIDDFSQEKPSFVAFGILSLAMKVIDDSYYIQKYYRVIIDFSDMMKSEKIDLLNQRLLLMWIQKGIGDNQDRKEEFKRTYEIECIKYALNQFSYIKRGNDPKDKFILAENKYESDLLFGHGLIGRSSQNIPFYVLAYQHYFDIYTTVELIKDQSFKIWLNEQNNLSKKEKNILKNGIYTYKTLKKEDRKKYLELMIR